MEESSEPLVPHPAGMIFVNEIRDMAIAGYAR